MKVPVQNATHIALLEAEILYMCADLGGDVLAQVIGVIDSLHAGVDDLPGCTDLADVAIVLPFTRQPAPLDVLDMLEATG